MDTYKTILNEIAKPICGLNEFQMQGVIERMARGSMEDRLCCEALTRLNRYVNLTLQLTREMKTFANELQNEQETPE